MPQTFNFLAPALHPNTILEISIPEPGPSTLEPVVKHLPIKYGEHKAVGNIKRMLQDQQGNLIVADDAFRISTIKLDSTDETQPPVPTVLQQEEIPHRGGDVWTGLISVKGGSISALTSGLLTYHRTSGESLSRRVGSLLLALASPGSDSTVFALAGKEIDVSEWDVEATFAPGAGEGKSETVGSKRKKTEMEAGEVWRAKNMPNNSLALRPPNHHICLTYLPGRGPGHLASGTKSGTIRVFTTQQRKPVHEWKIAREGGIGCIAPGLDGNEVFFGDRANLSGAMDLRTGRLLYSYTSVSCTPHHLLHLPAAPRTPELPIRLASLGSDATLRIHSNLPAKKPGDKGNVGAGRKAKVEGMVGGVGIGSFVLTGFGEIAAPKPVKAKKADDGEGEDGDGDEEDEESEDDEEVWEGMSEVEDDGSDSEEEELVPTKKSRK